MPQEGGIGKAIVALAIVALILVAALGLVLVASSQSKAKAVTVTTTTTTTTTVIPAQQAAEAVSSAFFQHMLLYGSGNVSAIVSQYQPNANVTWFGKPLSCLSGFYSDTTNIGLLMNFFVKK
ncbi:MAG: hypothetical protein ACRD6W_12530, partial [Nitrososphaerales archaeon]